MTTDDIALLEIARSVETTEDFRAFVFALLQNYRERRDEWENDSLETFLEALGAFSGDLSGYVERTGTNIDLERPGWRGLAEVLLGARVYD